MEGQNVLETELVVAPLGEHKTTELHPLLNFLCEGTWALGEGPAPPNHLLHPSCFPALVTSIITLGPQLSKADLQRAVRGPQGARNPQLNLRDRDWLTRTGAPTPQGQVPPCSSANMA